MKKYFKSYIFFALMAFALAGCKMDDLKDDVNDLNDRVTLLEEQVKILNENLEVMAYILNPENRTIQSVKVEGGKYNITLSNGDELVLNIGSEGEVFEPTVTISEDGFWVINGEQTTVKAQGEAGSNLVPEFRIDGGKWQVRYGNGGDWQTVQGEYNIDNVGDQFFESATVDGDMFVIMARDGETIYKLPIVKGLSCVINQTGETEGYIVFASGERKEINVKIEADNVSAPVYPQGWRAELAPKAETDADGFNYVLTVYAPSAKTLSSRASANNGEDIVIRVNKGAFWAVDKIKVKVEEQKPEISNNLDRFNAGILDVNGISVTKTTLGIEDDSQVYTITQDTEITKSGVYFVNADNVTLTYNQANTVSIDNVVIIPYTDDRRVNLVINKPIYLNKNFICKGVDVEYKATTSYVLRLKQMNVNIVMDDCTVKGILAASGFIMPETAGEVSIDKFVVRKSSFNVNKEIQAKATALNLVNNMDCGTFEFVDNIVYRSVDLTEGLYFNFKILNAQNRNVQSLKFNNNTIVGLESTTTGMLYAKHYGSIEIKNNIFWTNELHSNSMFIRYGTNMDEGSEAVGSDNIGYKGSVENFNFKVVFTDSKSGIVCPTTIANNNADFTKSDIFDTSDTSKFDTSNGIFIPNSDYTSYGAQR